MSYNPTLGMRASAPNVPGKSVNSLTNNQSGTPTFKVAVLHQVSPNATNPSMASVLIENRLPPVPGFSLPSGFGPVYQAGAVGAPANGPFYNNPATMEGGSLVTVDTVTNTVISLRQGVSTQFPSAATIQIQNHVHTGAMGTDGFPQPEQIDLTSHVQNQLPRQHYAQMPAGTTAVVSNVTAVMDHGGYPAYNVSLLFSLDNAGTTASPWLNTIQLIAVPVSADNNLKTLYDVLGILNPGTDYTGASIGGAGATYRGYVGGLSASVSYNIYAVYQDYYGDLSIYGPTTTALIATTTGPPLSLTNLPSLPSTLPPVHFEALTYSGVGQTSYNANVKFDIDYTGTAADQWLEELKLYAQLWDTTANGGAGGPVVSGGNSNSNLITNPTGASGLSSWTTFEARSPGVGTYSTDSINGGRFVISNPGGISVDSLLCQYIPSATVGETLTLSGLVQIDEFDDVGPSAIIGVDVVASNTGVVGQAYFTSVQGATPFQFSFTVPDLTAGNVQVRMHIRNSPGSHANLRGYFSQLSLQSGSSSTPVLVNIIGPDITADVSKTYFAEWPGLSINTGANQSFNSTAIVYKLLMSFVAENNEESDQQFLCFTQPQNLTIYRPAFATLSSTSAPAVTVDGGYPQYPYDGDPVYACDIVFDTTDGATGTASNPALDYLLVSAFPVGTDLTQCHNLNIVSPQRAGYDYAGSAIGIGGSRYKVRVGGLNANTHYVIVVQYVDFAGTKTSPASLVSDTGNHPVTVFNLPGVGSIPGFSLLGANASPGGNATFNELLTFSMNSTGIDTSWIEEIELYSCLWNPTTNAPAKLHDNVTYASPVLVNTIAYIPSTGVAVYLAEYPSLITSNGIADSNNNNNTQTYYALGLRLVAQNGTKTDNSAGNGTFGHSDPVSYFASGSTKNVYSSAQVIARPTLASIPTTAPTASLYGTPGFPYNGNPFYDCEFIFQVDSSGTQDDSALNYIQLVAYPDGADISSSTNAGKILYDVITPLRDGYDYTGASIGTLGARYHAYVGGLAGGTNYSIAIIYVDFSGGKSSPTVILDTASYGSHAVTNNNLPGLGTLPTVSISGSPVYSVFSSSSGATQTTFNVVCDMVVNYTGSDAITWLQEIQLWACLWDPTSDHPLLYGDGVSYASPFLANTIAATPLSTGSESYLAEYPAIQGFLTSQAAARYKLGVRFVAKNGALSDNSAGNGVYGHSDPVTYFASTGAKSLSITRPALATMPTSYSTPAPSATTLSAPFSTNTKQFQTVNVTLTPSNSDGYSSNPWLDKIRIFALNMYFNANMYFPGYGAPTDPYNGSSTSGNTALGVYVTTLSIYQLAEKFYDVAAQSSGAYSVSFVLPVGRFYTFFFAYIDHSGNMSEPQEFSNQTSSGPGVSSFGVYSGYFSNFTSGIPSSQITPSASASLYFNKIGSTYNVQAQFAADNPTYPAYVEYVEFWLVLTASGTETGSALQRQRLPVSTDGHYNPSFVGLTLSAVYHMYIQYVAYGDKNNPWPGAAVYFRSNASFLTMTVPSS